MAFIEINEWNVLNEMKWVNEWCTMGEFLGKQGLRSFSVSLKARSLYIIHVLMDFIILVELSNVNFLFKFLLENKFKNQCHKNITVKLMEQIIAEYRSLESSIS